MTVETLCFIGLWRTTPAWRALTPAQRAAWLRYWATCEPVWFAPARQTNGDLYWAEVEEEGERLALCPLRPPEASRSFTDLRQPLGMSDFLVPLRWIEICCVY